MWRIFVQWLYEYKIRPGKQKHKWIIIIIIIIIFFFFFFFIIIIIIINKQTELYTTYGKIKVELNWDK